MNRGHAYSILARELVAWRQLGYERLLAMVGQEPSEKLVRLGEEGLTITIFVWKPSPRSPNLRIEASADGPSCWRMERLEEHLIIGPE